jgi:glycosyltransferase involved in cell wall biosynthesis
MSPKVSIITVTYNCESLVGETLLSCINQTYENKEIIVIDGKSTDGTLSRVKKYESRLGVIISEKDNGIFDAMNKGISLASGEWIIFMNSGDSFVSDTTLSELKELLQNSACGVIYAPHILRYNNHERLINDIPFFEQKKLYRTMGFSHQSCLVRTSLASKYGFSPDFKLSADYKIIWSIYYDEKAMFIKSPTPIAVMDDNGGETVTKYKQHLIEECIICGFRQSIQRKIFIEIKYWNFKIKRLIKRLIY